MNEIKYSYEVHYCHYTDNMRKVKLVYFINEYKFVNEIKRLFNCKMITSECHEIKKLEDILFLKGIILKLNEKREIDSKTYKLLLKTITLT